MKKVAIIIVNWNGIAFLPACFEALRSQEYPHEIFFVDNGSTDESVQFIERVFPETHVIRNAKNTGFAVANNQGIAAALALPDIEYIALLNNDTSVEPHWLEELVRCIETHPRVGVVASKIMNFRERHLIDSAGIAIARDSLRFRNRGYRETDEGQYETAQEVFAACAAACLIRRETLEDLNVSGEYFDEDFGSYVEDVDLCIRARLMGWLCWYSPKARIYHIGSGTSARLNTWKYEITQRNRILTVLKNFPPLSAIRFSLRYMFPTEREFGRVLSRFMPLSNRSGRLSDSSLYTSLSVMNGGKVYFFGDIAAFRAFPKMLQKRMIIQRNKKIAFKDMRRWFVELAQ